MCQLLKIYFKEMIMRDKNRVLLEIDLCYEEIENARKDISRLDEDKENYRIKDAQSEPFPNPLMYNPATDYIPNFIIESNNNIQKLEQYIGSLDSRINGLMTEYIFLDMRENESNKGVKKL